MRPRWAGPEVAVRVWRGAELIRDEQRRARGSAGAAAWCRSPDRASGARWSSTTLAVHAVAPAAARPSATRTSTPASPAATIRYGRTCQRRTLLADARRGRHRARARRPLRSRSPARRLRRARARGGDCSRASCTRCSCVRASSPTSSRPGPSISSSSCGSERSLFGLKVHLALEPLPPPRSSTGCRAARLPDRGPCRPPEHLDLLEAELLPRVGRPGPAVPLRRLPRRPHQYDRAIEMLDRWPQLHLVTSMVWLSAYLRKAIERHPDRVLLGSDSPAGDPVVAATAIERLGLARATERAGRRGEPALPPRPRDPAARARARAGDLRFPLLPGDLAELGDQGFEVVGADELPPSEPADAKAFWAGLRRPPLVPGRQAVDPPDRRPGPRPRAGRVLEFGCNVGRNLVGDRAGAARSAARGPRRNEEAVAAGVAETGLDLRCPTRRGWRLRRRRVRSCLHRLGARSRRRRRPGARAAGPRGGARGLPPRGRCCPSEGKVVRPFRPRRRRRPRVHRRVLQLGPRTAAARAPAVWRLDRARSTCTPRSLGPYYAAHLAWLDPPVS